MGRAVGDKLMYKHDLHNGDALSWLDHIIAANYYQVRKHLKVKNLPK